MKALNEGTLYNYLDGIFKYKMRTFISMTLYKNGNSASMWGASIENPQQNPRDIWFSIDQGHYQFKYLYYNLDTKVDAVHFTNGSGLTSNDGNAYSGRYYINSSKGNSYVDVNNWNPKLLSEYYFSKYSSVKKEQE